MNDRGEHPAGASVSELPNVTLQITPFHVGGLAAAGGPITILRFSDRCLPDIVYLEQMTSAIYLDKQEDVDNYLAVMDRLAVESEPRANTPDILRSIIADLDDQTDTRDPEHCPVTDNYPCDHLLSAQAGMDPARTGGRSG